MLQINKPRLAADQDVPVSEFISPAELYTLLIGFLRRQYRVVIAAIIVMLALGAVYILTSPPHFTGRAVLVIDTHKTQLFQLQSALGDLPINSDTVDTQIEILNSESIGLSVVKDLHLTEDPEFVSPRSNPMHSLLNLFLGLFNFGSSGPSGEEPPSRDLLLQRAALRTLQDGLTIKRVGLTYAIEIDFKSLSPKRAAQVANAAADAYVADALDAKYQTTRRAAGWLQDRLKELRDQSATAERAVVDYKSRNNIVDTGGRLMNEQQLGELNSALVQARALTTETKARLDRVQEILKAGDIDPAASATATVTDTLHNEVIVKLRQQYLDYDAKQSLWTKKYGAAHLAVINLHNQMQELRRTMLEELRRIAETYQSDYEIAKTREDSVQKSLNQIVAKSQTTNEAQITLHSLEANAQTSRALYDSFLQRHMESVQQQSFPVTESRLITQATPPLSKSAPRTPLIMALAGVAGLMIGIAIGMLREISDRAFRTKKQVEEQLQTDCITLVPIAKDVTKRSTGQAPFIVSDIDQPWTVVRDKSVMWKVVDSPFSPFAEAIRAIKVAVDKGRATRANKIIGVTSTLPNEGKSTIAVSLAEIMAQSGARTLLIDCDLRNPSLSRTLAPSAEAGLLDVVANTASFNSIVWTDLATNFEFLPAGVRLRIAHSSDVLAAAATGKIFEMLREVYDYIVVDLAPLAPVVDVHAMTHLVNSFVFVIEWGRTKVDATKHALATARGVYENLLGVVLNKTDVNALMRYESNHGNYYRNRYYARYGYLE